jgi:hypothetical protein
MIRLWISKHLVPDSSEKYLCVDDNLIPEAEDVVDGDATRKFVQWS